MEYLPFRKKIEELAHANSSDIDWIFCEVLGVSRSHLASNLSITKKQQKKLINYAKKLRKGIPLAQILGNTDFYNTKIFVSRHVLCPRAETEELADMLIKDIAKNTSKKVLDLCTGSGAIAICTKKVTNANVVASDISKKALSLAKKSAKLNGVQVKFVKSNLFDKVWGIFDYIICNPPYIDVSDAAVDPNVRKYEPYIALFAKDNGYEFYKKIAQEAKKYLLSGGKIYLEVGTGMAQNVAKIFEDYKSVQIKKDLEGIERFVIVTK